MKIKDVINEASFLNRLGSGMRGALQGYQTSQNQRAGNNTVRQQVRAANLKQELADWKRDMATFATKVDMTNPANFQQVLKQWANMRYPEATVGGRDAADITAVKPNNSSSIANYISAMYNAAMDAPSATPTAATTTPKATTAAKTSNLPVLSSGVQVVSPARPIILRWKKNDYAMTDNNTWVFFGSNKPASPEMSMFLNKNLEEL